MDLSKYLGPFLDESRENLQSLNCHLLDLEKDPGDAGVIQEIFRIAHSLKGMSATMGFNQIAGLTHEMESTLDLIRNGSMAVSSPTLDLLFACLDALETTVNEISEGGEEPDLGELTDKMKDLPATLAAPVMAAPDVPAAAGQAPQAEEASAGEVVAVDTGVADMDDVEFNEYEKMVMLQASKRGWTTYRIDVVLEGDCLMRSARAYMVVKKLEDFGELVKAIPTVEDLEAENFENTFTLFVLSLEEGEHLKEAAASISEVAAVTMTHIDLQGISGSPAALEGEAVAGQDEKAARKPERKGVVQTVRVDIERLDTLMNLMGELVIQRTRLLQIGLAHRLKDLTEAVESIGRITTDLQGVVMQVRMVPLEQVFTRFPRMVRDLAKELGKDIDLEIIGQDTELDRTVIDEIGDPLVHLLRNAVDHGMEMPDERKRLGKPVIGKIVLSAQHEGNHVVIKVSDDGRGIDPETLKRKAIERGIITELEAAKMSEGEALNIIMLPGFSTMETATDVSGRGVGMDVVKGKIESLNGSFYIDTEKGMGTTFVIELPLTLAIIQALMVEVGPETYAIPLEAIHETLNMGKDEVKHVQSKETILLRGSVLRLVRLSESLKTPKLSMNGDRPDMFVVICKIGDNRAGLVVDTLIGQQEIVIKSLPRMLGDVENIAGATILGDGKVALIIDVADLV